MILKNDKQRASYYNYYTSKKWGDASSYDLVINTSKISVDNAVDLINEADVSIMQKTIRKRKSSKFVETE